MAITEWTITVADHITTMLERMPYQFNGQATFEAIVSAMGEEVQNLDDALVAAIGIQELTQATGDILDDIYGALVDEDRGGASDDQYRQLVKTKIKVYHSTGSPEEIIDILLNSLSEGIEVRYHEADPLVVVLGAVSTVEPTDAVWARIQRFIDMALPGGVQFHLTGATPGFFAFDGVATTNLGFSAGRFGRGIQ